MHSASIDVSLGINNIFNSYQRRFDQGYLRDSGYIFGPMLPAASQLQSGSISDSTEANFAAKALSSETFSLNLQLKQTKLFPGAAKQTSNMTLKSSSAVISDFMPATGMMEMMMCMRCR